jgi:hypothetical protein
MITPNFKHRHTVLTITNIASSPVSDIPTTTLEKIEYGCRRQIAINTPFEFLNSKLQLLSLSNLRCLVRLDSRLLPGPAEKKTRQADAIDHFHYHDLLGIFASRARQAPPRRIIRDIQ